LPTDDDQWIGSITAFMPGTNDAGSDAGLGGGIDSGLRVQATQNYELNGPSISLPFAAATVPGNHIVVLAYWDSAAGAASGSISDSAGDSFQSLPVIFNAAAASATEVFFAEGIDGGRNTVTLVQPADAGRVGMAIFEYAGLAPQGALDAHAGQAAPGASRSAFTPAVTLNNSNELLFSGFIRPDPNEFGGAGLIASAPGWAEAACSISSYFLAEDQVVTGAGSYTATAQMPVSDGKWTAVVATFRLAQLALSDAGDAGGLDGGTPDAGQDAGAADGSTRAASHDAVGCDCGQPRGFGSAGVLAWAVAWVLARCRRRAAPYT
jgi:hypothetical protein